MATLKQKWLSHLDNFKVFFDFVFEFFSSFCILGDASYLNQKRNLRFFEFPFSKNKNSFFFEFLTHSKLFWEAHSSPAQFQQSLSKKANFFAKCKFWWRCLPNTLARRLIQSNASQGTPNAVRMISRLFRSLPPVQILKERSLFEQFEERTRSLLEK